MTKIRQGQIIFIVRKKIKLFLFFCFLCYPTLSWAHREDYIDETLVFQTLEKGDIEPEYWFDYGRDHKEGKDFLRHNLSAEYGITDHWMVDGRGGSEHGSPCSVFSSLIATPLRFGKFTAFR